VHEEEPNEHPVSRRKSGGITFTSIDIRDTLDDPLHINELPDMPEQTPNVQLTPNLPPPTQPTVFGSSPSIQDSLHIPPYIISIGAEHPEVLVAYITNHSKQLELKRAQEETIRAQLEATVPTSNYRYNTSTLRTAASRGSTGESQDPPSSNPWFDSQIAEVWVCVKDK
jgi:hypothetical protein